LSTLNHKLADNQVVGIAASCICDAYSLNGEKITSEVTDILLDCIFKPVIEDNGFAKKDFDLRKQELIDAIDAEINDKRTYAIIRANSSIYKNEPSAITAYGNRKGAEKLNPQMTYNQYKELLKTAQIEIMFVGGEDNKDAINKLKQAFSSLDREFIPNTFENLSPIKSQVCEVTEEMDVNQCKMVMAFKSEYNNIYANRLMTTMLGGTAFSKLFTNVREKYSLCYYCAAGFVEGKGVLIVDSGVEYSNIPKAKEEILNQIKALATGDFTHDEMKNAVLSIAGDYKSNYDSTSDLASWYFIQSIRGDNYTPEQAIELLEKITREDIIESASALKLDTIYIMKGSESQEGEE
jgi:predicted Zn-dependent peptidase